MLRLVFRYLWHYRYKTCVLTLSLALAAYLPVALAVVLDQVQTELAARAGATPLVVGARGSRFDLTLHALYFQAEPPGRVAMRDQEAIDNSGLARGIPVYLRYRTRGFPLVGTTLDYFAFRRLQLESGTPMLRLGDCVVGKEVAEQLQLSPGDSLLSDPSSLFDIKEYPLKMRVVGVLRRRDSPDDRAVFCDVRTTWIIDGIGHGHQDLSEETDESVVLQQQDGNVVANAALPKYTEVTDENIATFHFHGDQAEFPLTAVIAVPRDAKSSTLLRGRYVSEADPVQLVVPRHVIGQLWQTVFRVEYVFRANALLVAVSTGALIVLVVLLSLRLRSGELRTFFKLGCSRGMVVWLVAAELSLVAAMAAVLVVAATGITAWLAPDLVRHWLFMA